MLERFQGCLVGVAVGDALGQPLEFLPDERNWHKYPNQEEIKKFRAHLLKKYPNGLNEMVESPLRRFKRGEITDDTEQTLAMVDNFLGDGVNPEKYANRLVEWYENLGEKGCGKTTRAVIELLKSGVSWDKAGLIALEDGAPPANGSLMRTAPVGLYFAGNPVEINQVARMYSLITHAHPDAILACQIASQFIGQLVEGKSKDLTVKMVDKYFLNDFIRVMDTDPTKYLGGAFTTLKISINAFLETNTFEEALIKAINTKGDADSYGGVTGAFAGAYYGTKSIPRRWSNALNPFSAIEIAEKAEKLFNNRYSLILERSSKSFADKG